MFVSIADAVTKYCFVFGYANKMALNAQNGK